jgi:hypothetical protein
MKVPQTFPFMGKSLAEIENPPSPAPKMAAIKLFPSLQGRADLGIYY